MPVHVLQPGDSVMIQRLVIFRANEDLTARYPLPALAAHCTADPPCGRAARPSPVN
jgi:hypothetical protein